MKEIDMANGTCTIEGCEKARKTRGMCGMHVERVRRYGDPHAHGAFIRGDDQTRFWSKVTRAGEDECWLFDGTIVDGYGQFRVGEARVPAHRWAYEQIVGPIPNAMELDHVWDRGCSHRNCVNPAHLEPVSTVENVMRSNAPSAVNARKVLCSRGHEFDRVVHLEDGRTWRRCSTCHRMKTAESKQRQRARRVA